MSKTTQAEIATELGVSAAALSKLKKAGMPVHSADAARAWRKANLHPGRVRPDPGPSARTLVDRAHALLPMAREAVRADRFVLVADALRAALRAVPPSHRGEVALELELWAALIGPQTVRSLSVGSHEHRERVAAGTEGADDTMGDDECDAIIYGLACGEWSLLPAGGYRHGKP